MRIKKLILLIMISCLTNVAVASVSDLRAITKDKDIRQYLRGDKILSLEAVQGKKGAYTLYSNRCIVKLQIALRVRVRRVCDDISRPYSRVQGGPNIEKNEYLPSKVCTYKTKRIKYVSEKDFNCLARPTKR